MWNVTLIIQDAIHVDMKKADYLSVSNNFEIVNFKCEDSEDIKLKLEYNNSKRRTCALCNM